MELGAVYTASAKWEQQWCRVENPLGATSRAFPSCLISKVNAVKPLDSVQISIPVLSKGWITPAAVGRNPLARDGGHCSFPARQHSLLPNHTAGRMSATPVCCFLCMVLEKSPSCQVWGHQGEGYVVQQRTGSVTEQSCYGLHTY